MVTAAVLPTHWPGVSATELRKTCRGRAADLTSAPKGLKYTLHMLQSACKRSPNFKSYACSSVFLQAFLALSPLPPERNRYRQCEDTKMAPIQRHLLGAFPCRRRQSAFRREGRWLQNRRRSENLAPPVVNIPPPLLQ